MQASHQLRIAPRRLAKLWFILRQQHQPRMATVAGATPPPAPLVVARPPTVVPRAIRHHEFHVRPERGNHLVQHHLVVGYECIQRQRRQRFFHVVTQIHGPAALRSYAAERMPLANQESFGCELLHHLVRQLAPALHVVLVAKHPPAQHKRQRRRHRVVDVPGLNR